MNTVLLCNWVEFNKRLMRVTKLKDVQELYREELKHQKRKTFLARLESRARYLAAKSALK